MSALAERLRPENVIVEGGASATPRNPGVKLGSGSPELAPPSQIR
jgi:hypothetical protein